MILICALLLSGAPPEKHLSVYSVAANYSLPLVQREGRQYVGLLEVLEPLGKVSARSDSRGWRLRYNNVEGDFQVGKTRARVQGRDSDLGGRFLVENNRGLVPVASLTSLLPRFLGGPATLHEESGRLFIGSVATHFTAALTADNPPRLVFHFTAPVNPSVATEPGALRMTFAREPLVAPASPTLTFGNKTIPSAIYSEGNGAAHGECLDPGDGQLQPRRTHGYDFSRLHARAPGHGREPIDSEPIRVIHAAGPGTTNSRHLRCRARASRAGAPLFCRRRRQPRRRRSRRNSQHHAPRKRCHRGLSPEPAPGT
jgi:hypothetical protein